MNEQSTNQIIIFDLNRTLYDPERQGLLDGALELVQFAAQSGYTLLIVGQASASRAELIKGLEINDFITEVQLVEHKTAQLFESLAAKYQAEKAHSYVIGDRAHKEILLGHQAGWQTIWLKAGKFAAELPAAHQTPTHTVATLHEIHSLI